MHRAVVDGRFASAVLKNVVLDLDQVSVSVEACPLLKYSLDNRIVHPSGCYLGCQTWMKLTMLCLGLFFGGGGYKAEECFTGQLLSVQMPMSLNITQFTRWL